KCRIIGPRREPLLPAKVVVLQGFVNKTGAVEFFPRLAKHAFLRAQLGFDEVAAGPATGGRQRQPQQKPSCRRAPHPNPSVGGVESTQLPFCPSSVLRPSIIRRLTDAPTPRGGVRGSCPQCRSREPPWRP